MSVLTAANQLTLLRLLLVPVFALCILYGLHGWALVTFGLAGITDVFDGMLARRSGPTVLGAWLDPAADKLLVLTMFVMLAIPGLGDPNRLPLWLTVLVLSRDIGIVMTVAIFNLAVARRTFPPTLLGKVATVVFVTTGVAALFGNYRGEPMALVQVCIYASGAITLMSGFHYVLRLMRPGSADADTDGIGS
jgi:cardiolipin synthase